MPAARSTLADPRLHRALGAMVRKRVPESDADDIVQAALAEALASKSAPDEAEALRRWVFAVAKNKIADHYRKRRREQPEASIDVGAEETPYSERDLLRWAEEQLPPGSDAPKTLEWMLREGDGEKLESIALSEKLPAPRVRQRVSRMRRFLRERWVAAAALGVVVAIALYALYKLRNPREEFIAVPSVPSVGPVPTAEERLEIAKRERKDALGKCDAAAWRACLEGLDRAAKLDPAGDTDPRVTQARDAAAKALAPPPPVPSSSATPAPTPRPTPTSVVPTVTATPTSAPPRSTPPSFSTPSSGSL